MEFKKIRAGVLNVAFWEAGPRYGWPCIMGHGFPYDVLAYEQVTPLLVNEGARVIIPYLRGYGPTRFISDITPRSGEQAALGSDLLALMDALEINQAVVGGYDWGGRAACVVSALWPERVTALVSGNSYNIQNISKSTEPIPAVQEAALWYQYYFQSERGRRGLTRGRRDIALQLWKMWSPAWNFDDATFNATASAFDNPDFVDVVIHSYRHRYGLATGDPMLIDMEAKLAHQPSISVPAVTIDGDVDGVNIGTAHHLNRFNGPHEHRIFSQAGHNLPQERPVDWAQAVLDARAMTLA